MKVSLEPSAQKYIQRANQLRSEIDTTTNQIGQVTARIHRINGEIQQAQNQIASATPEQAAELQTEIDSLSNDVSRLTNTRAQLTESLAQQNQGLDWATRREKEVSEAELLTDNVKVPVEDAVAKPVSEISPVDPDTSTSPPDINDDPAVQAFEEQELARANQEDFDTQAQEAAALTTAQGVQVRTEGTAGAQKNIKQQEDWRLRLSLSPNANYLYKTAKQGDLLYPLQATSGIVFPYTPQISINYRANYDPSDLTHTNYKYYFYKNSSVDEITITADFTAQDTNEANYVLAVTHFFKSVTKMFYGQDGKNGPRAGTPPPLCYLTGYGQFQFNNHPLLISGFQYTLPNDVDYIRAGSTTQWAGQNISAYNDKARGRSTNPKDARRASNNLEGKSQMQSVNSLSNSQATYIPTKIQFIITAIPVATRAEVSNVFSVEKYATGELLRKGYW
jgi:hypothetical protein